MDHVLFQELSLFDFFFDFFISNSSKLFVKNLVFFHSINNIFECFCLHFGVFIVILDVRGLFLFLSDLLLQFFPLLSKYFVFHLHELNLSLFKFHAGQLQLTIFAHSIKILAN